ncbi:MAG TPA: trehalose-phosphatase [Candidatus Deferrimicrobiaceae bacterium]|nr:trehalose-phosphatase [Candidatus Deferrimicrobiaceae bacterium]
MSDLARLLTCAEESLAGPGSILLMTDYDGTLTPLVDDPADAMLAVRTREDLARLARSPRARVALISGRGLEDLRARVALDDVIYAGCHGLEVFGPNLAFRHPDALAQQAVLLAVGDILIRHAPAVRGMRVEAKGLAVAVHYRHVAADEIRRVEIELARAMREQGSRLKIFHGSKVIEVLPQVAWTKGECAQWIQERLQASLPEPALWLYLGDDWTDEHAFEVLSGKALTIRVGDAVPASKAAYRLRDVSEVHRLLARLAAGVAAESHA